jgi:hypothetical protein
MPDYLKNVMKINSQSLSDAIDAIERQINYQNQNK